ncbi:MAG: hypothetical protein ACXABF_01480 [Candidatus Thorarchaeota archaeon]|jgi:hypothetical protein
MLSGDVFERISVLEYDEPDPAWVAGAAAGLSIVGNRGPNWKWDGFIEDVYQMIEDLGGITPAEPGTLPLDGNGSFGSLFDTLGGYVSLAGKYTPEGLYVRVPLERHEDILSLLPGMTLMVSRGGLTVPKYEINTFLRLVPVRGPLADELLEEVTT